MNRRRFLTNAGACAVGAAGCWSVVPQSIFARDAAGDTEKSAAELITPKTAQVIKRGLEYLTGRQQTDGELGNGGYSRNVAVVGLAGMALIASGSTPGRGPYGKQIDRCLDFILANAAESGFIDVPSAAMHGPMYGHGFATLFLAECYGMTHRADLRDKLTKAVQLIVNTQNPQGGWRYQPHPDEADISVTSCELMALRAARNAGLHVPRETMAKGIEYVKKSQNEDGGFMYTLIGGPSAFPRSAAAIVALYSAGIYEGPEIKKGLEYLVTQIPRGDDFSHESHYFYGHYYAVQAMWQAGGDYWTRWYPAIRDALVNARPKTAPGSTRQSATNTAPAWRCIILQIPNNYLPIFQR